MVSNLLPSSPIWWGLQSDSSRNHVPRISSATRRLELNRLSVSCTIVKYCDEPTPNGPISPVLPEEFALMQLQAAPLRTTPSPHQKSLHGKIWYSLATPGATIPPRPNRVSQAQLNSIRCNLHPGAKHKPILPSEMPGGAMTRSLGIRDLETAGFGRIEAYGESFLKTNSRRAVFGEVQSIMTQEMIRFSTCLCALLLASVSYSAPAVPSGSDSVAASSTSRPSTSALASASAPAASSAPAVSSGLATSVSPSSTVVATGTKTSGAVPESATVPSIDLDPNFRLWNESSTGETEPIRGSLGVPVIGPTSDESIDKQNADLLAPPTTDHGSVGNAKWPFSLSHNRLQSGGWARQENVGVMPLATEMASVNMRLQPGAVREMHWHKTAEWAYVLKGTTQVAAIDPDGKNYVANVGPGDLWYFPAGIPHSLQATDDDPDGSEFILVFDTGSFSEDSTLLLTDCDVDAFKSVPAEELYIFPANLPEPPKSVPKSPQGTVPEPFSFKFSQVKATQLDGGSVKVVDSSTFAVSKTITAAEVTVEPGAMRELHWHPTQDEWSFFLEGSGRMTIFAAQSNARTFDYQAGDIGYVPASMGHYVENTGNTTLRFLEIFRDDKFQDVSLNQWLALSPPELVKAHLGFSDDIIAKLKKTKPTVIGPA
ncbi:hypothetical protein NP233_g3395 [Leucocoprinus birnbaumii]|uniref:Cupin type-1 domain-containing protein n=1 Tax=Leucocoprinus birnbaumii TaxID=56174 RepID=A0AAD5VZ85_9AGAR|nr:hypothetical protein NP233_g3395 [Leucocoprinus birnbaumii]